MTSYDEVHADAASNLPGQFPGRCPICKALIVARESVGQPWEKVTYACWGGYTPKPQIQNHTHKWWGSCGKK